MGSKDLHLIFELLGIISGLRLIEIAGEIEHPKHSKTLQFMGISTLIVDLLFIMGWAGKEIVSVAINKGI